MSDTDPGPAYLLWRRHRLRPKVARVLADLGIASVGTLRELGEAHVTRASRLGSVDIKRIAAVALWPEHEACERWQALGLPRYTAQALTDAGVLTAEQLRESGKDRIARLPNLGPLGMRAIDERVGWLDLRRLPLGQVESAHLADELRRRGWTAEPPPGG